MFRCLTVLTAILALTAGVRAATLAEVIAARDAGDYRLMQELLHQPYDVPTEARDILAERLYLARFNADLPEMEAAMLESFVRSNLTPDDRLWSYYDQFHYQNWQGNLPAQRQILDEAGKYFDRSDLPPDLQIAWLEMQMYDALAIGDSERFLALAGQLTALPADSRFATDARINAELGILFLECFRSGSVDERYQTLYDRTAAEFGADHPVSLWVELEFLMASPTVAKAHLRERLPQIAATLEERAPESFLYHFSLPQAMADLASMSGDWENARNLRKSIFEYWRSRVPKSTLLDLAAVNQYFPYAAPEEQTLLAGDIEAVLEHCNFFQAISLRKVLAEYYQDDNPVGALKLFSRNRADSERFGPQSIAVLAADYAMLKFLLESKFHKQAEIRGGKLLEACRENGNAPIILLLTLTELGINDYSETEVYPRAVARLDEAAALTEVFNQADTPLACNIYLVLGYAQEQLGDYAAAREAFGRAQRIVESNAPHLDAWTIPAEQLERLKNR